MSCILFDVTIGSVWTHKSCHLVCTTEEESSLALRWCAHFIPVKKIVQVRSFLKSLYISKNPLFQRVLPLSPCCFCYHFTPLFKSPQGQLTFNSCHLWTFQKMSAIDLDQKQGSVCWSGLSQWVGWCVSLRTWELYRPSRSVTSAGGDHRSQEI